MLASRNKLIGCIVQKKLFEEVDQILNISRQGFDVFVHVEFHEIKEMLIKYLEEELKINSREFKLIESESLTIESLQEEENFMPTVLIGEQPSRLSYGFVHYAVRPPDQLIGNVAAAVEMILEHFNLLFYLDVFDSKKLSRLKQIAKVQGIKSLIDAVVQTAYYGGFKGDNECAQAYLDKAEFLKDADKTEESISLENCAKKFLAHAVTHGQDAHLFIKSCLSYFVVSKQGHTMTRASQILSISRTTLQEHLKIASQLGVSSFLEGHI